MLLSKEPGKSFSAPPKMDLLYKDLTLHEETASYRVYEAEANNSSQEKHLIRILDPSKDLVDKDFDSAATLFIQELFHLENRCPGTVLIGTLEICRDRKQIACALRKHSLMNLQLGSIDLRNPNVIKELISDVLSDVKFLRSELLMENIASIVEPENMFHLKIPKEDKEETKEETEERDYFYLTHWEKILQQGVGDTTTRRTAGSKLTSQDLAAEIRALAFALLKIKQVDLKELKFPLANIEYAKQAYESSVKSQVAKGFSDLPEIQDVIERMLSFDPKNFPSLEELIIGNIDSMSVILLYMLSSLCVIHLRLNKTLKLD